MAIASNFPSTRPSLLLDFANVGRLDPRVTFARASSGTYYDGVTTAKAEENLLVQSQTFNTTWATSNAVVTADTTAAPDGNTTADTITDTVSSTSHRIQQDISISTNTTYVFSCWLKAGTSDYAYLSITDTGTSQRYFAADFDLNAGTVTASGAGTSGTLTSSSITEFPAGSGWYRCVIIGEVAAVSSNTRAIIGVSDGTTALNTFGLVSYVGTGTTIIAWGAQLEQRSAVTAYTATTTQPITNYIPVLQTAAAGVARFDHNPTTGEALGLLIEEQRTNLQINSEDFTSVDWSKGSNTTITANSVISPAGTLTADTFGYTAITSGVLQVADNQTKAASAITYTGSIYVKATSGLYFHFYVDANGTTNSGRVVIDTSNWSVFSSTNSGTFTGTSGTVTPVGNGWYRITCTTTSGTETNIRFNLYWSTSSSTVTFTPAGTEAVYIWGAQLEAGAFATSYIPTTSASVTRNADAASMTGTNFSDWFNNAEGTLFADSKFLTSTPDNYSYIFEIDDGTSNNRIYARYPSFNAIQCTVTSANSTSANFTLSFSQSQSVCLAYKVDDFAAVETGGSVDTDTSGTVPSGLNGLYIGDNGGGGGYINGTIRKLAYYPQRLTDAQLQALTG